MSLDNKQYGNENQHLKTRLSDARKLIQKHYPQPVRSLESFNSSRSLKSLKM
jgi:hypothetical protein